MICNKCGVDNEEGAKFCSNCGVILSEPEIENETVAEQTPEQQTNEQVAQNKEQPVGEYQNPLYYQPPVNPNPFGEQITDNTGSYSAAPTVPPINQAPPVPPYQPAPMVPPQMPPQMPAAMPPMYPYGANPFFDPYEGKAKAAKTCGILSIVLTCVSCGILWIAGAILGVIGIVLGSKYQNKVSMLNRSKAKTGLVCGIIGVSICLVVLVLSLIINKFADSSAGQDFYRQFQEQFDTFIRPIIF